MRASNAEKTAIRELCIKKRSLTNAEKEATRKRKRWTQQKKAARDGLNEVVPDGVAYKIGESYVRRKVYNRMNPIKRDAVLAALREITVPEGDKPFVDRLCASVKKEINDGRRLRGEYVETTTKKPRKCDVQPAPTEVLELAALDAQAVQALGRIAEETGPAIKRLRASMAPLEKTVMSYMNRTRKERQRVSISDSLSGGGDVSHGFSILRKKRETRPVIKMSTVVDCIREHVKTKEDFLRRKSAVVRAIMARLDDEIQTGDVYYLSMVSGGIRE